MGRIADSLRANLREVAKSDARSLKEMDEELRSATQFSGTPQLKQSKKVKALLGQGSWDQTNKTLQDLCRKNGIKKFSGLNKAGLVLLLRKNGVKPPPKPIEKLLKKELVSIIKELLGI